MKSFLIFIISIIMFAQLAFPQVRFIEMAEELNINEREFTCGVGIVNVDKDVYPEIITGTHIGSDRFYKWQGEEYLDMGVVYGFESPSNYHHQVALVDINYDHHIDIYISGDPAYGIHAHLYLNSVSPPFEDVASDYNLVDATDLGSSFFMLTPTSDLALMDGSRLKLKEGDVFVDITQGSGLEGIGNGLTPIFTDIDGDGDQDLIVGHNYGGDANLLRNNGDGTFTNISSNSDYGYFPNTQGLVVADFDGDGDMDFYTTGAWANQMWYNDGTGYFTNATDFSSTHTSGSRGASAGDFDNDGDIDLYINSNYTNILFLNNGDGTFIDYSNEAGIYESYDGGGCAVSDLNNDGQLDIVAVNFFSSPTLVYINQNVNSRFLKVEVIGQMPNTMALGAIVKLYGIDGDPDNPEYIGTREVRSASTMYSVDDPLLHFGTGNYQSLRVVAKFSSLAVVDTSGILPGQTITIFEPEYTDISDPEPALPSSYLTVSAYPNPFNSSTRLNIKAVSGTYDLAIYDVLGRLVKSDVLAITDNSSGYIWDGTNNEGHCVPSGLYFVRVANGQTECRAKLTLLR